MFSGSPLKVMPPPISFLISINSNSKIFAYGSLYLCSVLIGLLLIVILYLLCIQNIYHKIIDCAEDDNEQPTEGEEEKEAVTYQISTEVNRKLWKKYTICDVPF